MFVQPYKKRIHGEHSACKPAHELCFTNQTAPTLQATQEGGSSRKLMELMGEKLGSVIAPTPSEEGCAKNPFECPLCVDVFQRFSQLKWHLLTMHPRRQMIMELVNERYGATEEHIEAVTSSSLDSQLSTSCQHTAGKFQPMMVVGTDTTFKVPLQPRCQTAAVPKIRNRQFKSRSKVFPPS